MFTLVLKKTKYHLINRFYMVCDKKKSLKSAVTAQFYYTNTCILYVLCF